MNILGLKKINQQTKFTLTQGELNKGAKSAIG